MRQCRLPIKLGILFFFNNIFNIVKALTSSCLILGIVKVACNTPCRHHWTISNKAMITRVLLGCIIKKTAGAFILSILVAIGHHCVHLILVFNLQTLWLTWIILNLWATMATVSAIDLLPGNGLILVLALANHIFNDVLSCFSDCVLVTNINIILIRPTTCSWRNIAILQTLNRISQNPVVFSILNVLPLHLLEVTCPHIQLLSLLSKLLFILIS